MNEIWDLDDNCQRLDRVDYGSEWEDGLKDMDDPAVNKQVTKTYIYSILNRYMSLCPIDRLETKILSVVCPYLKQYISEIFDEVEKKLDDLEVMKNEERRNFDSEFIDIKDLLKCWHEILKHVAQFQKKTPSIIKSLLEHLPSAVIRIYSHCKNNRTKYFNCTLPQLLQHIYRCTCSIVKNYCALFFKSFEFNLKLNDDLIALKQVITSLGDIAPYTSYGMSTMIQTWRTFTYLACVISNDLLREKDFIELVRNYFKSIWNHIIKLYKKIMMRPVAEFISQAKCSNLLFTIFIELHENYCTDRCPHPFSAEFIHDMIQGLIEFTGYYELCHHCNIDSYKSHKRDEILQNVQPNIFHNYYKNSEHYLTQIRAQLKAIKNMDNPDFALGFHFYLLHYEMFEKQELLDMALENINNIQVELMEQVIRIPGWTTAKGDMREVCIYDYTQRLLCRSCNFAQDADIFSACEDILLKYLLSEQFWSSLLAYDILIFCYRCSNKDVAFTHIQYFTMAYDALQERRDDSLGVMMLRRVILDIYELLPENKIDEFLNQCKSPASLLFILKSNFRDRSRDKVLAVYKKLESDVLASSLPEIMNNLEQQPTVDNWMRLIKLLTIMGIDQQEHNDEWNKSLLKIAINARHTVKELDDNNSQRVMYDLILLLFDCARIRDRKSETCWFNWPLFEALAEGLFEATDIPECFLIKLCYYLKENVDCLIGPYNNDEATIISDLFIYLLENNSQFVHQEALECFEQVLEKSTDAFVKKISNAIVKRPKLCEAVPAYLKGEPFPKLQDDESMPEGWRSYIKLISHFNDFSIMHKCYKDEVNDRPNKFPRLCEESLDERVERLTNELRELSRKNINFNSVAVKELKDACRSFIHN